jgi:predicted DNA-binding transcriptional regulator YafY
MKRTKSQYARLIELDRKIRSGSRPNCLTFAENWGVSQKTVQRDIDFLRDQCGAPIAYDRDRKGFYYEDTSWWLPTVTLSEGELLSVLLASRVAEQFRGSPIAKQIERVFDKLADMLPDKVSINPAWLSEKFTFTAPPAKSVDEGVWAAILHGLLNQRTVRIAYRPFDVETLQAGKQSRINPLHIANLQGEWYVFATHHGYSDVRQFAMARIEKATATDLSFDKPPGFDPETLLSSTFARYAGGGEPQTVRIRFDKAVASWVTERQWHPQQKLVRLTTGDIELEFPAKGLFEVQRWVLSWGSQARVLAPPELVQMVDEEVAAMAKTLD